MPGLGRLEVLGTAESERWREVLEEIKVYDFYHLPAYHRLAEMRGEGKALMPVYRRGGITVAFPMLIRQIELPGADGLKDATSVNGFVGPVSSTEDIPEDVRDDFQLSLQEFFKANGVVSVYHRLSAVIDQSSIVAGWGEVVNVGVTLAIDLTLPPEVQVRRYSGGHRHSLERLKKLGFTCEEVGSEYLDDFIRVYYDTMSRVNAEPVYHYDRSYFEYLLYEMSDVTHMFVCSIDGVVVSACICALSAGILEALLLGTATEYLRLSPAKLLYDARREWGNSVGARIFHLGGGAAGKRDSLYDFKVGFGAIECPYSTWRLVVDRKTYDELTHQSSKLAGVVPSGDYFPTYRDPAVHQREVLVAGG